MRRELPAALAAWCGAAALAVAVAPTAVAAAILTCVGPAGEVLYSNIVCPPGYSQQASEEERGTPPPAPLPVSPPAPAPAEQPPAPPRAKERVDEQCFTGTFQAEAGPGEILVSYTNTGPRPCMKVRFYCLWGLGFGMQFYQQSDTGSHEGRIEAGATVPVGVMTPTGPSAGDVSWSWCSIR